MVLEQLDIHMQKLNLDTYLTTVTKLTKKWIIDLNVKWKTIKLLEDNIGENLHEVGYCDAFLDQHQRYDPWKNNW